MEAYLICAPCTDCLEMLNTPSESKQLENIFTKTYRELENAAEAYCPFCMRFLRIMKDWLHLESTDEMLDLITISIEWEREWFLNWFDFELKILGFEDNKYTRKCELQLYEYLPETSPIEIPHDKNRTFEVLDITHWIKDCQTSHSCGNKIETTHNTCSYLPPRLIYCANQPEDMRLMEAESIRNLGGNLEYVTLSHSWGQKPPLTILTTENYTQLLHSLNFENLSKTFQDAVMTVRNLGLQYLWIDSLCIIQEGEKHAMDWQIHVKEMSQIYRNCILNIAASFSKDSHGGLFRSAEFAYPHIIDPTIKFKHNVNFHGHRKMLGLAHKKENSKIGNFSLNFRGWVYQERLMSPRTIHYDQYQLYWECYELVASNAFPKGKGGPEFFRGPFTYSGGEIMDDDTEV